MIWTVKIFKSFGGRVANSMWSNSYHINTNNADMLIEDPAWKTLVEQLGVMERTIHLEPVNFMRATLSSLRQEPEYDPRTLRVFELQGIGERGNNGGGTPMPLDMTLKVKKNVGYGRSGTMFYRGCLNSTDVSIGAGGDPALKSPGDPGLFSAVNGFVTVLTDELSAIQGELVMPPRGAEAAEGGVTTARIVQSFAISGISINSRNHRYFDTEESDDGVGPGT